MQTARRCPIGLGLFAALALVACSEDASRTTVDAGAAMGGDTTTIAADMRDVACSGEAPAALDGCGTSLEASFECVSAQHIPDETPIAYDEEPPACGPHRSQWARWGEYAFLPAQRYIHNLEHGGIAFLVHPCASADDVAALRAIAESREVDDGGPFRWVLTPYPDLPTNIAVLAWCERYLANCVNAEEIGAFIDAHYRTAPEDVSLDGRYSEGWVAP